MGLVLGDETKGEDAIVLTDILGSEDALGDMDFKVAGDGEGMSAFQMDIKVEGISLPVMRTALARAREGLIHILGEMDKADPSPRKGGEMSKYAPRIEVVEVNTKYIGKIIGKGGEQIKSICEETRIDTIDINNDGVCVLTGSYGCDMARALEIIAELTIEPEIGKIYRNSRVTKVLEFGAFVEILPGVEGLCHVSELDVTRVANVKDVVNDGDFIDVKLLETNERGQYKLSRREVLLDDGKGGGSGGGSTPREDPASRFLSENGQNFSGGWDSDRGGGGGRGRSSSKARRGRTRLRE
jgi:polyribonucleotide nucleotidyltransferase